MSSRQGPDRMRLVDAFYLTAACAVPANAVRMTGFFDFVAPAGWSLVSVIECALAVTTIIFSAAGPLLFAMQFILGRRERLLPGERAWCVSGAVLAAFFLALASGPHTLMGNLGMAAGTCGWPVVLTASMIYAVVGHARLHFPRRWSHRLGIGVLLLQAISTTYVFWSFFLP